MKWLPLYLALCIPAEALSHGSRVAVIRPAQLPSATALTYFAQIATSGCATPTNAWRGNVSARINALSNAGILSTFDALYFLGAADACTAKINAVAPASNTLVAAGACFFTPYWGMYGDGSTCSWSMVSNLSALSHFTQNNAHVGVYVSNGLGDTVSVVGTSASGNFAIRTATPGFGRITRLNNNGSLTDGTTSFPGYASADRSVSTSINTYFNGASLTTAFAGTSTALQTVPAALQRFGATFSAQLVCEFDIGSALTAAQEAALYTQAYKFGCTNNMVR